jgi:hypothetical protein
MRPTQALFTSPLWGEVGMGALRAPIPGEGVRCHRRDTVPLTRIAQARSDLSPEGRGDAHCETA